VAFRRPQNGVARLAEEGQQQDREEQDVRAAGHARRRTGEGELRNSV
jgi:hypothetical protein